MRLVFLRLFVLRHNLTVALAGYNKTARDGFFAIEFDHLPSGSLLMLAIFLEADVYSRGSKGQCGSPNSRHLTQRTSEASFVGKSFDFF